MLFKAYKSTLMLAPSPGVRFVHSRNLSRNGRPFELSSQRLTAALLQYFLPFQELVCEAEMWLDDDVQPASTDIAAVKVVS